jgi:hypothetical protein
MRTALTNPRVHRSCHGRKYMSHGEVCGAVKSEKVFVCVGVYIILSHRRILTDVKGPDNDKM